MRRLVTMATIAAALVAAGCGGDSGGGADRTPAGASADAATSAPALRAAYSASLADQIFLTGEAVAEAVRGGPDQPQFAAGAAAAKAHAAALERLLAASVRLNGAVSADVDAILAYAKAKLGTDAVALAQAKTAFVAPNVRLGGLLTPLFAALHDAVDAILAKDPKAYVALGDAAAGAPSAARRLAGAAVTAAPEHFDDMDPDGAAASIRGGFTALLVDDTHLALLAADAIVRFGADSRTAPATAKAVDANAVAFSHLLSSVYGEDAALRTLKLWRVQARLLTDYAKAKVDKDDVAAQTALTQFELWRNDVAELWSSLTPQLPKARVAAALNAVSATRTGAVRADAAHSDKTFARFQDAAAAGNRLATLLAQAIALQYPGRFGA